jgi:hypothetical protein
MHSLLSITWFSEGTRNLEMSLDFEDILGLLKRPLVSQCTRHGRVQSLAACSPLHLPPQGMQNACQQRATRVNILRSRRECQAFCTDSSRCHPIVLRCPPPPVRHYANCDKMKRKTIQTQIDYFEERRDMMHYDEYHRDDLVLATGVIEGACRYVVGERLDCAGFGCDRQDSEGFGWRVGGRMRVNVCVG